MTRAGERIREGRTDEAVVELERARSLFPEYAGDDAPGVYLADIHERQGDIDGAIAALEPVVETNESFLAAHLKLAELYRSTGDARREAEVLSRSMFIWPLAPEPHARLAELAVELGDWDLEIRERKALVALGPVDMAEARYRLALAYERTGDLPAARSAVLAALEVAPNYAEAQELLLRLHAFEVVDVAAPLLGQVGVEIRGFESGESHLASISRRRLSCQRSLRYHWFYGFAIGRIDDLV